MGEQGWGWGLGVGRVALDIDVIDQSLLCVTLVFFHVTAIPLREKKQKTLPRSDGCGLNNFDGTFIHCLSPGVPQDMWIHIYHVLFMPPLCHLIIIELFSSYGLVFFLQYYRLSFLYLLINIMKKL